jgi:hypothetical protein
MSYNVGILDPEQRAREKQESRDRDQKRLADGSISPEELSRKNSAFAALPIHECKIVAIGGKRISRK